jgi:thiosulfate/3-mercaptopyruvate sulfurtransferase
MQPCATPLITSCSSAQKTATDFGNAARAYWTLKSLGMTRLSILNGGLTAWRAAGLPVSDQPASAPRSAGSRASMRAGWPRARTCAPAWASPACCCVDARPAPYFQGRLAHDAARARGTLPGAVHLDSELFFELGSAALLDKASAASRGRRPERRRRGSRW